MAAGELETEQTLLTATVQDADAAAPGEPFDLAQGEAHPESTPRRKIAQLQAEEATRALRSMSHVPILAALGTLRLVPGQSSPDGAPDWGEARWQRRVVRRIAVTARIPRSVLPERHAVDVAHWSAIRAGSDRCGWRRRTRSYVVLCYHRVIEQIPPGQERWSVTPGALRTQLRLLRLAGWHPLTPAQQLAIHAGTDVLPRRRYVLTADDGFTDAVEAFSSRGGLHPQLFAVTGATGLRSYWWADAPLADWDRLRNAQRLGVHLGSHCRRHVRLAEQDPATVQAELSDSLADLRANADGDGEPAILAYPHGSHSDAVCAAARDAGYALAYTTQQGRNTATTDPWRLRRVEPKPWDSVAMFAWRVLTGESPPRRWEQRLERRWRARHQSG